MLTPVDLKQKKFKTGLGYDKKDVGTFFDEVSESYQELYKANAELKSKVLTLTDEVQHYKLTEEELQKKLMVAEKNAEVSKSNAAREAKTMEMEAKARANEIVSQAYRDLDDAEAKFRELQTKYNDYKKQLVKKHLMMLGEYDFDPDAYLSVGTGSSSGSSSGDYTDGAEDFFDFGGEGGGGGNLGTDSVGKSREENRSSASKVYGDTLGGEGIDPFTDNPNANTDSGTTKKKEGGGLRMKDDTPPAPKFRGGGAMGGDELDDFLNNF